VIRYGIAGWSYADWKGIVYPPDCSDALAFCARYVDCIEVNSTFYRIPTAKTVASWAARTADRGTVFTAKLHQAFTHEQRLDPDEVGAYRDAMQPLRESGRLRALLAQFSFAFAAGEDALAHLRALAEAFSDLAALVVEVRHASFAEAGVKEQLRSLGVSVAQLDYPRARGGFHERATGVYGDSDLAYLRLHGRNAGAWFRRDAGRDEVYDWEYSAAEVGSIHARVRSLAAAARETIVIGNNHFAGKGLKVALQLKAADLGRAVDVPPLLAAAYPDLRPIASGPSQGTLF
jgi:uncharacterized protein YecE (DUF72 family)